jgi:hypothetical protein
LLDPRVRILAFNASHDAAERKVETSADAVNDARLRIGSVFDFQQVPASEDLERGPVKAASVPASCANAGVATAVERSAATKIFFMFSTPIRC